MAVRGERGLLGCEEILGTGMDGRLDIACSTEYNVPGFGGQLFFTRAQAVAFGFSSPVGPGEPILPQTGVVALHGARPVTPALRAGPAWQ